MNYGVNITKRDLLWGDRKVLESYRYSNKVDEKAKPQSIGFQNNFCYVFQI